MFPRNRQTGGLSPYYAEDIVTIPFVLQIAQESVSLKRQASPLFYRNSRTLAVTCGVIFLIATWMSLGKTYGWWTGGLGYQAVSFGLIGLGLWLNRWDPQYARSRATSFVNPDQPG